MKKLLCILTLCVFYPLMPDMNYYTSKIDNAPLNAFEAFTPLNSMVLILQNKTPDDLTITFADMFGTRYYPTKAGEISLSRVTDPLKRNEIMSVRLFRQALTSLQINSQDIAITAPDDLSDLNYYILQGADIKLYIKVDRKGLFYISRFR